MTEKLQRASGKPWDLKTYLMIVWWASVPIMMVRIIWTVSSLLKISYTEVPSLHSPPLILTIRMYLTWNQPTNRTVHLPYTWKLHIVFTKGLKLQWDYRQNVSKYIPYKHLAFLQATLPTYPCHNKQVTLTDRPTFLTVKPYNWIQKYLDKNLKLTTD